MNLSENMLEKGNFETNRQQPEVLSNFLRNSFYTFLDLLEGFKKDYLVRDDAYDLLTSFSINFRELFLTALLKSYFDSLDSKKVVNLGSAPSCSYNCDHVPGNMFDVCSKLGAKVLGVDIVFDHYNPPKGQGENALAIVGMAEEIDRFIREERIDAVVSSAFFGYPITYCSAYYDRNYALEIEKKILKAGSNILKRGGLQIHHTLEPDLVVVTNTKDFESFCNSELGSELLWKYESIDSYDKYNDTREKIIFRSILSNTFILRKK